jgi:hypothetical protein
MYANNYLHPQFTTNSNIVTQFQDANIKIIKRECLDMYMTNCKNSYNGINDTYYFSHLILSGFHVCNNTAEFG